VLGGIFLRRGETLIQMSEQRYAAEADLQALLGAHPDLLTADGEPHRWLLVSREFGIASEQDGSDRWSLDHLFLDEEGVPTLVEVKRSTDTRIRREVVGQMLDYAANALSYWNVEAIKARFEAAHEESGPVEAIATHLGADIDPDLYWERVGTNLAAGRVRLVFVADVIPPELRAIVEFLNGQMSPADVLAVEIRQYVDGSGQHQTLVPRLIGDTQVARRAKGHTPRVTWTEQAWIESFRDARGDDAAEVAERLMSWARDGDLEVAFATGAKAPSALLKLPGRFTLVTITQQGRIEVYMGYLQRAVPFDDIAERRELKVRLESIPLVTIDERRLDKFPSFPLDAIAAPAEFAQFTSTLDWVLARIQ
jgi:hypothetical protein